VVDGTGVPRYQADVGSKNGRIGQCEFGFAPTRPQDRDLNMRMMNRIGTRSCSRKRDRD
jgi:N-acyl-D-aspartate/D-glutamate deacylase